MKKLPVLITNIVIVIFIIFFVVLHVTSQGDFHKERNRENFVNMTVGLERVTTYYLEGEQRLCNSWGPAATHNFLAFRDQAAIEP